MPTGIDYKICSLQCVLEPGWHVRSGLVLRRHAASCIRPWVLADFLCPRAIGFPAYLGRVNTMPVGTVETSILVRMSCTHCDRIWWAVVCSRGRIHDLESSISGEQTGHGYVELETRNSNWVYGNIQIGNLNEQSK